MNVLSVLPDNRINAFNVLVELPIEEYLNFAFDIIDKNEFQRRKVIKAKIREIFKEDLQKGCLFPPIVLATYGSTINEEKLKDIEINSLKIITEAIQIRDVIIIDGLQRTFVMLALREELSNSAKQVELRKFLSQKMRAEIYVGIRRMGLLYRMITLNTGQTTMSTRHLMEILFLDYTAIPLKGIRLIRDKNEESLAKNTAEFSFKDILDGFNSFIEKDEGIIDRSEILDNIRTLDMLTSKVDLQEDLFKDFTLCYKTFLDVVIEKSNNWVLDQSFLEFAGMKLNLKPFGENVLQIFKRSQVLTGFGASLGVLKDQKNISLIEVQTFIGGITTSNSDWNYTFCTILSHLDIIANKSKKIGNDQRYYFKTFFRSLFNKDSDFYLNVIEAAENASNRTREIWEERKLN